MFSSIFEQFAQASPITVMLRATMERVFSAENLDTLFDQTAQRQYTRELLFSTVVGILSLVVCQIRPSVSAAYKAFEQQIGVSRVAFYSKLNGIEPQVSQALVRYSASELTPIIEQFGAALPPLLPGYRVRIIDGNCIAASEHRLGVLRSIKAGALPGKSLVVLDPDLMLALDQFPCEDAYTQERALLGNVVATVQPQELWIADRNFCTCYFLSSVAQAQAYFVIRQHQSTPLDALEPLRRVATTEGQPVFEQPVQLEWQGQLLRLRRIVVQLDTPTRQGDLEVCVLTNLAATVADAIKVSKLYLKRWTVEGLFQMITQSLSCEINSLGYPKAALFSFAVALVAYNLLAVVKAALSHVHGAGKIEAGISDYYLVEEVQATYHGMMIALPVPVWEPLQHLDAVDFAQLLARWAAQVDLKRFASSPRGKKKPPPQAKAQVHRPHVSTARLLDQKRQKFQPP